ncbi:MAG TPA: lytic transglycosylase domain-containing protein [Solirubrobacteraceae bacterium]
MSTHTHSATRRRSADGSGAATRRTILRRRLAAIVAAAALTAAAVVLVSGGWVHHAVREITLPLRHEDIIRQQAQEKGLDPALIAGVIYAESHFRDGQTSSAGALGLMQLTPRTARYIARKSGGTAFVLDDLATPQVNIAYGAYYLRYLLQRYGENETLALAAYNAGEGNVDRWIASARQRERDLTVAAIPYAETRSYVTRVEDAKREYQRTYRSALAP